MLLDTNALSAFADGNQDVERLLRYVLRPAIPVVVLGEFRYGALRSRHRAEYETWLDQQLPHFDLLMLNADTTLVYASLRVTLRQAGRLIPANATWVAALALQHGLQLISRDTHFDTVPDLRRVAW